MQLAWLQTLLVEAGEDIEFELQGGRLEPAQVCRLVCIEYRNVR